MYVSPGDLTAAARIRNAALERFAARGIAATSVRDVAAAAGVSSGLVQHHFGTKAKLRQAVNDHVAETISAALQDFDAASAGDLLDELGRRMVIIMRDHAAAFRYAARATAEGDAGATAVFDGFLAIAGEINRRLAEEGLLRDDLDRTWAALHPVLLNLATVLLEPAISRHLGTSFFAQSELERWDAATKGLFRHGLFTPAPP